MKKILKTLALLLALNASADMLVDDIRIEGLQRVSLGSVLDTVPITIGDRIDKRDYQLDSKLVYNIKPAIAATHIKQDDNLKYLNKLYKKHHQLKNIYTKILIFSN